MKIALVYPSFGQSGGAEQHVLAAARGLGERGHTVTLFTSVYDRTLYPPPQGFDLYLLGGRGFMEGIGGTVRRARQLAGLLHAFDCIIPVNFPANVWATLFIRRPMPLVWMCMEPKRDLYPAQMYREASGFAPSSYRRAGDYRGAAGLAKLVLRDPHVLLPYGVRASLQRLLDQTAVQRCTAVIANSPYTAQKVTEIYRHPNVSVGWAGVPLPTLLPCDPPEPLLIIPSRLEPIKNIDTALRAVAQLRADGRLGAYRLTVVGGGSDEARLRGLAIELNLADMVTFTGYIPSSQRDLLYARCSVVIYPALGEPLGLPCAEAALYYKPVIASHQGGPATLIKHEQTGLLVDMTDPLAVANALATLIADPDRAAAMGQAARRHVEPLVALPQWSAYLETLLLDAVSKL